MLVDPNSMWQQTQKRFLPMRKYLKLCMSTVLEFLPPCLTSKNLHILTILTTAFPYFLFYIRNLLIITGNTVFSARYELNLCIESFHLRLPDRAMAQAVSTRCLTSKNPGSRLEQSMWNFWRTKWAWDSCLRVLRFPFVSITPQMLRTN